MVSDFIRKVSFRDKKIKAHAVVVTEAIVTGAYPIPFSHAALLVSDQILMISTITVIFSLELNKSLLTGFVSSKIGSADSTIPGKTLVSNLLKLIPGVVSIAGGFISGSTVWVITTALKKAYMIHLPKG